MFLFAAGLQQEQSIKELFKMQQIPQISLRDLLVFNY
jgi:hypothetical protein